ncbi:MAG TPA: hypothetical protein DCX89_10020 [Saprospirales bacterium]|mgnify:CR=1 FL=1|nr:hypothetical protein [Saprospirales bacterium]HRQ29964.1 LptF/LptG family permease [Saprospiraceae bacterium]
MKLIDKFITRSFLAPYFLSFIVAEFVLVMQFLWLYIDELAGKGLTMLDIAELVVYYGVLMIPLAVPITILISSVMVFGEISEKFELSSMKSAGISLLRVMRYGIFIAIATFGFSLFVSNYLKPKAAYSFNSKLLSIRKKKPSISLNEKVFNKDFSAHTVYIGEKNKNGKDISKVKMYNHSQRGNVIFSFVTAEDGSMYSSEDEKFFIIDLRNGNQYQELRTNSDRGKENYPFIKTTFREWQKVFDLSEFNLENINPGLFSNKRELMNTVQLLAQVDTSTYRMQKQLDMLIPILPKYTEWPPKGSGSVFGNRNEGYQFGAGNIASYYGKIDQIQFKEGEKPMNFRSTIPPDQLAGLIPSAIGDLEISKNRIQSSLMSIESFSKTRNYYLLGLHQPYSWAFICIVFIFIGTSMGSIIRKGGYGFPVLFAILFFMSFIVFNTMGDRLVRSDKIDPVFAAWLPVVALTPIAMFLTFMAMRDAKIGKIYIPFMKTGKEKEIPGGSEINKYVE